MMDHPHVRGEKSFFCYYVVTGFGSSPRAWGKALFLDLNQEVARIIPTCVGKSLVCCPI